MKRSMKWSWATVLICTLAMCDDGRSDEPTGGTGEVLSYLDGYVKSSKLSDFEVRVKETKSFTFRNEVYELSRREVRGGVSRAREVAFWAVKTTTHFFEDGKLELSRSEHRPMSTIDRFFCLGNAETCVHREEGGENVSTVASLDDAINRMHMWDFETIGLLQHVQSAGEHTNLDSLLGSLASQYTKTSVVPDDQGDIVVRLNAHLGDSNVGSFYQWRFDGETLCPVEMVLTIDQGKGPIKTYDHTVVRDKNGLPELLLTNTKQVRRLLDDGLFRIINVNQDFEFDWRPACSTKIVPPPSGAQFNDTVDKIIANGF